MAIHDTISVKNGYQKDSYTYYPVLIIGAGESGIAMGCRLKTKLGFDQFRIFDRQSGIGGTWHINRYPGVACDVPSALYSFSFAPYYTSETLYPTGPNFVKYLHSVAANYKIVDKIQLNTDITELRYVESHGLWEVTLSYLAPGMGDFSEADRQQKAATCGQVSVYLGQEKVRAKVVVSCAGILVEPNSWPANVLGSEAFKGPVIHSARWRDDVDFRDKDVVVVGTGCSAAQLVPSLLEAPFNVKSVTQIMRTPPWVMPRLEEPFGKDTYARYAPTIFRYFPILGFLVRISLYLLVELIWYTVFQQKNVKWRSKIEASTLNRMLRIIPEKYHAIMTPTHPYGCKRRVFDSAWLKCMSKPNFHLTTRRLERLESNSAVLSAEIMDPAKTGEGFLPARDAPIHADIIVLANGFEGTRWLHPLAVYGRNGKSIHNLWDERGGPQAYMGTAVDGFPNFFMTTGPNTANGHSSIILGSESITEYILKIVEPVLRGDALYVEPKTDAEITWTSDIQKALKKTVFPGCASWYQDEGGWNSTMYPRSQSDFAIRCAFPKHNDWVTAFTQRGIFKQRAKQIARYTILAGLATALVGARVSGHGLTGLVRYALLVLLASMKRANGYLQRSLAS